MFNPAQSLKIAALFLMITVVIASCAPAQNVVVEEPADIEAAEGSPTQEEVLVTMTTRTFEPAQIIINAGTTVRWENTSSIAHTVTSGTRGSPTGEFDVNLAPGESFSYTFEETGVIDYYCIPHSGMDGIVTVE